MRTLVTLLVGCLIAVCACKKSPGPPSAEWEQAQARHLELVTRFADDAYGRPEMDEVLGLLAHVSPESVDAPEAVALQNRIIEERKRLAAQLAERQRIVANAGPANWNGATGSGGGGSVAGGGGGNGEGAEAAKPALTAGMALEEFKSSYGDCFELKTKLRIDAPDGGVLTEKGEAYSLKGDPACKEKHSQLADKLVVFGEGKLVAVQVATALKQETRKVPGAPTEVEAEVGPDGGLVPKRLPDGGYIPISKDGGQ